MKDLIAADIHLGQISDSYVEENGEERSINETEKQLYNLLEYAVKNLIKRIIIAGDIFENKNPISKYNKIFNKWLKKTNEYKIEVILLDGNHDKNESSISAITPIKNMNFNNVLVFDSKICSYETEDINYIMVPHLTKKELGIENIKDYEKESKKIIKKMILKEINKNKKNVLIMHIHAAGGIVGAEQKRLKGGINLCPDLKSDYISIIFSGHLHSFQKLNFSGIDFYYPGSITRNDFSETKENKGFLIYNHDSNNVEFIKLNTTEYKVVKINLIEKGFINLSEEKVEKSVKNKIVKIVIDISEENKKRINLEEIISVFSKYCFVARNEINVIKTKKKIVKIESYNPKDVFVEYINENVEDKEKIDFCIEKGLEILNQVMK